MKILANTFLLITLLIVHLSAHEHANKGNLNNTNGEQLINEQEMLEILGYISVYRDGLKELGFGDKDAEAITRGVRKALSDDFMDPAIQERMPEFQKYIEKKIKDTESAREESLQNQLKLNKDQGIQFIEGLKTDNAVKSTPSGLYYKIIKAGNSKRARSADTVRVHYKGTRIDDTVFDSSYSRGKPVDFSLQGVVPGFAEGLTKIGEGGEIILYIPSDLAYGDNPRGGLIQPGDTLIFECELIKINP